MLLDLKFEDIEWGTSIELPSSRSLRSTAHIIGGKYPCRSIALIPRMILSDIQPGRTVNVLDPFMGSGTTAIEAGRQGFASFGLEVDPYARLISDLSVHLFSMNELEKIKIIRNKICKTFKACKANEKFAPTVENIDYWFSKRNYNDLLKLKTLIFKTASQNKYVKSFFLLILADIVRASSKAERQSLKPYISKRFVKKNIPVLPSFERAFQIYFSATKDASEKMENSKIRWLAGDATKFSSSTKMDVAITSPPYINAMDYVRCIKLESAWVGTGNDVVFSNLRKAQLGEEARTKFKKVNSIVQKVATPYLAYLQRVDAKRFETALVYFQDMHDNLVCVRRTLKKKSSYHLIIGNSVIRNVEVPTHEIIAKIAEKIGYNWVSYMRYPIKDHRTSLPRNGRGGKISEEHVISLRKI